MKFELISFPTCPFVQRSVITLKYKKVPFDITYIDLYNPPGWFNEISPLGQVPVLKVDDKDVIFESAVINELIDELTPPSLQAKDPIQKAKERAWIEYGSSLFGDQYSMLRSQDKAQAEKDKEDFFKAFSRVEAVLSSGPYFRGKDFSLVDAAYAPLFTRLFLIPALKNDSSWSRLPKTHAWGEALLDLPAVRESVREDFETSFLDGLRKSGSCWL